MPLDVKALGAELGALIADTVAPIQKELAELRAKYQALESRQPERGEKGEPGIKGDPGKDAPPVTDEQIAQQVEKYLKANPPPRGEKGEPGEPGPAGKDAEVDPRDVARLLLDSEDLESLVELRVKEEVAKIPPPKDGKDGAPGEKGDPGPQGPKGDPGQDGAGIQDLLIDRDGNLVATMTDGRTKSLGIVIGKDGAPGRDGKDGADFSDVTFEYDGERTLTIRGKGGEITKRLPIPIDRGYWKKGVYEKGDIVTEGGTAYIALKDTSEKPDLSSADWRILARKGRDGKDGRNGIDKTAPVSVKKGSDDA
jgi:hypothetical protein